MRDARPAIAFIITFALGICVIFAPKPHSALVPPSGRVEQAECARAATLPTCPRVVSPAPLPSERESSDRAADARMESAVDTLTPAKSTSARLPYRIERYTITAYCQGSCCCQQFADGLTASGEPITANGGKFCAAPKSIPFFTLIDIPGYGVVPVLDRGGAIGEGRLDVYFPTHEEALDFGVKYLDVTVHERKR